MCFCIILRLPVPFYNTNYGLQQLEFVELLPKIFICLSIINLPLVISEISEQNSVMLTDFSKVGKRVKRMYFCVFDFNFMIFIAVK